MVLLCLCTGEDQVIRNIRAKLESDGVFGVLKAIYHYVFPYRLKYYPFCKAVFETGRGLEIGGPSPMFRRRGCIPVYSVTNSIDNCNFERHTTWEGTISEGYTFAFAKGKKPGYQHIAEATNLEFIENSSYDFVLSSHCIEHLANPLQALSEWIRVLKDNGLLVLVVPHKDGTFDHRRPTTSLAHLIQDFNARTGEGDLAHLEEILRLHDLAKDPGAGDYKSFKARSERNIENRCLHQHAFDTRLAVEMINQAGLQILAVELFLPYHILVIAQKMSGENKSVNNACFRGIDSAPCWISPFPSDEPGRVYAPNPADA